MAWCPTAASHRLNHYIVELPLAYPNEHISVISPDIPWKYQHKGVLSEYVQAYLNVTNAQEKNILICGGVCGEAAGQETTR